jgi:hypothetical protein
MGSSACRLEKVQFRRATIENTGKKHHIGQVAKPNEAREFCTLSLIHTSAPDFKPFSPALVFPRFK